nr:hypothetical protein [Planctomycetota bacterium]
QEAPKPKAEKPQKVEEPQARQEDSDLIEVTLGEGQVVQMTREAVIESARLGILVGDRQMAENAIHLEHFAEGNPRAAQAIGAIIKNPALADVILAAGGQEESESAEGSDDPAMAAVLREIKSLRSEIAAVKGGDGGNGQPPEDKFAAQLGSVVKRFPALGSFPQGALKDAVQFRMASGMTMTQAVASLAAEQGKVSTEEAGRAVARAKRASNLRGVGGGGGTGPTSLKGPKKLGADDLSKGGVLRAAMEHLYGN